MFAVRISCFALMVWLLAGCGMTYNRRFLARVEKTPSVVYPVPEITGAQLDLFDFDAERTAGLFIVSMNRQRERKLREPLEQDSLLNRIAGAGLSVYNKKKFIHSPTWRKERQCIQFALFEHHSDFRAYTAYAFCFDVLDLEPASSFFCDKRNGDSPVNLYKGPKPKVINPDDAGYVPPEPVYAISEQQLEQRVADLISSGHMGRDLMAKRFARVGIALKIDPFSLNRNCRPHLFVVLICAGKQLQEVKVPDGMLESTSG